jgi:hypothetical protein
MSEVGTRSGRGAKMPAVVLMAIEEAMADLDVATMGEGAAKLDAERKRERRCRPQRV